MYLDSISLKYCNSFYLEGADCYKMDLAINRSYPTYKSLGIDKEDGFILFRDVLLAFCVSILPG